MLAVSNGKETLKELSRLMPERLKYWVLLRFVRSGYRDEQELAAAFACDVKPSQSQTVCYNRDA